MAQKTQAMYEGSHRRPPQWNAEAASPAAGSPVESSARSWSIQRLGQDAAHQLAARVRLADLVGPAGQHAVQDGGDVDRMVGPIAPLARQILKSRDDARGICHHAREPVERAARAAQRLIGAQRGHAQRHDVEDVVQVVRHAGGEHAHGMHALLVEQRLALALQLGLVAHLGGDVVQYRAVSRLSSQRVNNSTQ